jgi:hypothetical protein
MAFICTKGGESLDESYCTEHQAKGRLAPDGGLPADAPGPASPEAAGGPVDSVAAAVDPVCWACEKKTDSRNKKCHQCGVRLPRPPLVVEWLAAGRRIGLGTGESALLGREARYPDIFSAWDNVSGVHAEIGVDGDGQAWLRDNKSTNGTFVDGTRITGRVALTDGARISFGNEPPVEAIITIRKEAGDDR